MPIKLTENFRAVFYAPFYATQALGFYAQEGVEGEPPRILRTTAWLYRSMQRSCHGMRRPAKNPAYSWQLGSKMDGTHLSYG